MRKEIIGQERNGVYITRPGHNKGGTLQQRVKLQEKLGKQYI